MRKKEKHLEVGEICRYEKDENKKVEKLMKIYNENKDDYDLLVTIARNIGYDKKYREKATLYLIMPIHLMSITP